MQKYNCYLTIFAAGLLCLPAVRFVNTSGLIEVDLILVIALSALGAALATTLDAIRWWLAVLVFAGGAALSETVFYLLWTLTHGGDMKSLYVAVYEGVAISVVGGTSTGITSITANRHKTT